MRKNSIYQRKDGRFEGRIIKEKKPNGKWLFHYFFGKTKKKWTRR